MKDILYFNTLEDIKLTDMMRVSKKKEEHDYSKDYLTFEALEDGTFTFTIGADNYGVLLGVTSVSYSLDNGHTWVTTQRNSNTSTVITTPTVAAGSKVLWKGIATFYYSNSGPGIYSTFSSTGNFNVCGNIASLCHGDNFSEVSSCEIYGGIWKSCSTLISAENLILPATTLTADCYFAMFRDCISLTKAPKLPATTLASGCYVDMFQNCTALTTVPVELPATVLTSNCYTRMFSGCASLTTAPELPATTLVSNCYGNMFTGCSNLNYIKAMFTTTPSPSYTNSWVNGVAATGTFVKNSAATWTTIGANGIPTGWTVKVYISPVDPSVPKN